MAFGHKANTVSNRQVLQKVFAVDESARVVGKGQAVGHIPENVRPRSRIEVEIRPSGKWLVATADVNFERKFGGVAEPRLRFRGSLPSQALRPERGRPPTGANQKTNRIQIFRDQSHHPSCRVPAWLGRTPCSQSR